jgi:hypothetical protein
MEPANLISCEVVKTEASRRLVFGFAIVSKVNGADYYDLQDEHIPEGVMLDAALDFAKSARVALEQHQGDQVGTMPFIFPLTTEIAQALGIETAKTGMIVAMQADDATFKRFESGELTGFSIGGRGITVDEDDWSEFERAAEAEAEKAASKPLTKSPACRMDGESSSDCMSRKIPEIMAEDPTMEQDQAIAIAASLCATSCASKAVDPEELDEVFSAWRSSVNMSASELEAWSRNECSRKASLDPAAVIARNLRLLKTKKADWTSREIRDAKRTISFVARMRGAEQGPPAVKGCPSRRDISLKNWAFDPSK